MAEEAPHFIWYELLTDDPQAASAFYGAVVGWTIGENAMPPGSGTEYRMIGRDDGSHAGGVFTLTGAMLAQGARPAWLGYVHVADVDAEVDAVLAQGGAVHMPATTIEGAGRMAMLADPTGAPYYVMTPQPPADNPEATSDAFTVDRPQTVRWNELATTDQDRAVAFYTGRYGWTQEGAMPMGPLGDYKFIHAGGTAIGAIMPAPQGMPRSGWTFYFGVDDIDRATAAVGSAGGTVTDGPRQIPGGEFAVHASDPQGASFGLVGPRGA